MPQQRNRRKDQSLVVSNDQPLIAIPIDENGHEVVYYFTDDEAADKAVAKRRPQDGRHLAGVWKDLDWEEFADELERIRHESKPTPPIDLGDLDA